MVVGRWYVQLSAIWHWYLPLSICITFNFVLCSSIPFLCFSLTWYRQIRRNGQRYQHVLALYTSLNRGNIERTNSLKIDVWFLYMDFCFTFVKWLVFWINLTKHIYTWEKVFSLCFTHFSRLFKKNLNTYDFVPKGVHENRTKGVENKVDDTLKLVVFLECGQC